MSKLPVIHGVTFYPAAYEGKDEATFLKEQAHLKEIDNGGLTDDQLKEAYAKLSKRSGGDSGTPELPAPGEVSKLPGEGFKPLANMTKAEKESLDKAEGK